MFGLACITFGAILAPLVAQAAPGSGTVDLDLIFPRNGDTYLPVSIMPVVFAVQNPMLALPLDFSVTWSMDLDGNDTLGPPNDDYNDWNLLHLNKSSLKDPHFVIAYIPTLSGIETTWVLTWELSSANCSLVKPPYAYDLSYYVHRLRSVVFKTNHSAPAPDLQAAISQDSCEKTDGFVFNVTAVEELDFVQTTAYPSCSVLGPTPTTRNPCGATINPSAASSISSALSLSACEASSFTCTPTTSSQAGQTFEPSTSWMLSVLGLLLYWTS